MIFQLIKIPKENMRRGISGREGRVGAVAAHIHGSTHQIIIVIIIFSAKL